MLMWSRQRHTYCVFEKVFFSFFFSCSKFFFCFIFFFLFLYAMASPKSLIFGNGFFFSYLKVFCFISKYFSIFFFCRFMFFVFVKLWVFFFWKVHFFFCCLKHFFLYDHVGKYTSFFLFKNTILLVKPIITEFLLKELKQLVFCCQFWVSKVSNELI